MKRFSSFYRATYRLMIRDRLQSHDVPDCLFVYLRLGGQF